MKKIILILLPLIIYLTILSQEELKLFPVDGVLPMNDREYTKTLIKLFDSSNKTIHAVIYQVGYYPDYPEGEPTDIQNSLINAVKRGVKVVVIVDQSSWNPSLSVKNDEYVKYMRQFGIEVYFDMPDITTHAKFVVIDSTITVIGSTNWSFYALAKNNECAVAVKSRDISLKYEDFFEKLYKFKFDSLTITP
ncbi:MAG: phospholipase D-like domain-containing protein [candidate division WOR-3 bacterium]